ncbi:hypothetical protein RIF29_37978 [Crotalaria pallida]|uniref:Uncharacterized protein n=1 Tax=Crotalaria pallida TaxID=3830 RepID=A0AAN9DYR2_CROPI
MEVSIYDSAYKLTRKPLFPLRACHLLPSLTSHSLFQTKARHLLPSLSLSFITHAHSLSLSPPMHLFSINFHYNCLEPILSLTRVSAVNRSTPSISFKIKSMVLIKTTIKRRRFARVLSLLHILAIGIDYRRKPPWAVIVEEGAVE